MNQSDVKAFRDALEMSQPEFAEYVGCSLAMLRAVEHGRREFGPGFRQLLRVKLADAARKRNAPDGVKALAKRLAD